MGQNPHATDKLALLIGEIVTFKHFCTRKEVGFDSIQQIEELALVPLIKHTVPLIATVTLGALGSKLTHEIRGSGPN